MIPCTVVVKGREADGAFLVYQLTPTHAVIGLPEAEGQLAAVPLEDCRVASRYLDPGQAMWWQALQEAGNRAAAEMAAHVNGDHDRP